MTTASQHYQKRIDAVLEYIERHLNEDLSLEVLARIANFSAYHFHRQFRYATGTSVFRLVLLRRLKLACYRLAFEPQTMIGDIAQEAGFENAESFSRAFKRECSQTPSDFRRSPEWSAWSDKFMNLPRASSNAMKVSIVNFEATRVAVMSHCGAQSELNSTLQRFVAWRKSQGFSPDQHATFNILHNDTETSTTTEPLFDLCVAVPDDFNCDNPDIDIKVIPAGRCAVLRHLGSSDNIENSVRYLYSTWLPNSGEELRNYPLFFHRVKLYPAQVVEHEQITDVYLPLN